MPRRSILTERQRSALFNLPTDETNMLRHYILADDDLEQINARRRPENRIGFALQLCALRYPGRLLSSDEVIPEKVLRFIAAQLGLTGDDILPYASRRQTRQQHLHALRQIYGFKMFSGQGARCLRAWLEHQAETARSNEDLARRFVEECRKTQTILPGVSVIERLCADALVAAERRIESRIANRLDNQMRERLDTLLTEMLDGNVSRFVWLRQFEVGNNSAGASRLLDRLEFLQALDMSPEILADVPPHRVTRLRRQGERYFADGLRDITSDRRLAILAVCATEWAAAIADAVVETHDRIVGKTWRDAKKMCDTRIADARSSLQETLRSFKGLGAALLEAKGDGASLDAATEAACGWVHLERMVATAAELTDTMAADALAHVVHGYHRFRRYAPRMLRALDIHSAAVASPLIQAAKIIADDQKDAPYVLDGLLMNETGRKIKEQYADTGGFTDHVFAVTALLSYRFIPRIRDLPSKRLYLFDTGAAPKELRGLIGGKIREKLIIDNWPDILRAVVTMAAGVMPPSQLMRKLASYPRQHELAVALREIGRIERTLFIIEWLLDADMQRRAQIGLNKGEAHHALKNALRIGRQGEIRDRTTEGQHYRMAGLNLLAATIIYWNTKHLGMAVTARKRASLDCSPDLLAHISPLGWAHILLTGEYRWKNR